jgi:hypothetical protein
MMNEKEIRTEMFLNTNGNGLWSDSAKKVKITAIKLGYLGEIFEGGAELCVYFDTKTWDTEEEGLIYTDPLFLEELKEYFKNNGFSNDRRRSYTDIEYSEQGMQGDDYVSFDIGRAFLESWAAKFNLTLPSENLKQKLIRAKMPLRKV